MSDMAESPFERQNRIQAEIASRVKLRNETGQSALQEKAGETMRPIWKYRKEMEEKYSGFPLMSDREYDSFDRVFGGIIESSAAPDELRDQIETSLVLSKIYGATLEDVWNNYDHYLEEWDTSYRPKTTARAILDSVSLMAESLNYNRLGIELKHRKDGFDMELMAKIEGSRRRMAELQDNVPRPWYIEAAKFTINSLPLTAASLAAGAVTGGFGTALGLSSGIRAGLTLLASAGTVHAMTVGGEYNDLIQQGVRHSIASPLSEISSALQAVAEVALGNVGGVLAGGMGVKTVTGEITKRLFISGKLGAAGRALMEYASEAFSEGAEEVIQTMISNWAVDIAAALQKEGVERKTAEEKGREIIEAFKGGFLSSLIMGIPGSVIQYKGNVREAKSLSALARTLDENSFKKLAKEMKPSILEGREETDQDEILSGIWSSQQERKQAQSSGGLPGITEGAESESGPAPARPGKAVRLKDGGVYTQLASERGAAAEDSEGAGETGTGGVKEDRLLIGDPTPGGGAYYGAIGFRRDGGTLLIDSAELRDFITDRDGVLRDAVLDLAWRFRGMDIEWNPGEPGLMELRDKLIADNPRGPEAGLQWFAQDAERDETLKKAGISQYLKDFNIQGEGERRAAAEVVYRTLKEFGFRPEDLRGELGFFTTAQLRANPDLAAQLDEAYQRDAAAQGGKAVGWDDPRAAGGTFFTRDGKIISAATAAREAGQGVKAVIYAAENADFSTFVHEWFHYIDAAFIGRSSYHRQLFEKAMGKRYEDFTSKDREYLASHWEEYLRTGRAPSEGLRGVFRQIARAMARAFNSLRGIITLSPDLVKAYDALFQDSASPLAQEAQVKEADVEADLAAQRDDLSKNPEAGAEVTEVLGDTARKEFDIYAQKLADNYDGLVFNDEAGGKRVSFENEQAVYEAVQDLRKRPEVVKVEDGFIRDRDAGDMAAMVRLFDGSIAKLRLNTRENFARNGPGVLFQTREDDRGHGPTAALIERAGGIADPEARARVIGEIRELRERYAGTEGEYKAPNGKASLLVEALGEEKGKEAWYAVRTPSFKEWFGDWESAARIAEIEKSEPVNVTVNASVSQEEAEKIAGTFGMLQNQSDGKPTMLPITTIGKIIYHQGFDVSRIIRDIPALYNTSKQAWAEPEIQKEGHKRHTNIKEYRHYVNKFTDGTDEYYIRFTVTEENVKPGKTGRNIIHSSAISEVSIYKNGDDPQRNRLKVPGVVETSPFIDKRLKQFFDSVNPSEVSQVRDANGEPKPVFHGTHAQFDIFDRNKGDLNDAGWSGEGHYFYEDWSEATQYAKGDDGLIMAEFINVREPYYLSDEERAELVDREDRNYSIEFTGQLRGDGYDGVYYNGDLRKEWTVFDSTQIKSATGNAGTFGNEEASVLFQIIGEQGAEAMDQAQETSIRLDNLDAARRMEGEGKDAKAVRLATGWERGADGNWRYEIPDIETTGEFNDLDEEGGTLKLSKAVKGGELLKAYPQLNDISVTIVGKKPGNTAGSWNRETQTIELSAYIPAYDENGKTTFDREVIDNAFRRVLIHEIQHAIQDIEGFAGGGNVNQFTRRNDKRSILDGIDKARQKAFNEIPEGLQEAARKVNTGEDTDGSALARIQADPEAKAAWADYIRALADAAEIAGMPDGIFDGLSPEEQYRRLAGEAEARNVEARAGFTPRQRLETLLAETEDVSREDQIFLTKGAQMGAAIAMAEADGGTSVLHQLTEPELRKDAQRFESWEAWKKDVEQADWMAESYAPEGLAEAEKDAWYKARWEEARNIRRDESGNAVNSAEAKTTEELNEEFLALLEDDEELAVFVKRLKWYAEFDDDYAAADEAEAEERERGAALRDRIKRQAHTSAVLKAEKLNNRSRKEIRTHIRNGATWYRALYAEVMEDEYFGAAAEKEIKSLPDIIDPKGNSMSIVELTEAAKKIQDKQIREAILRREYVPDEALTLIERLDKEIKEDREELRKAEEQHAEDIQDYSRLERNYDRIQKEAAGLEETINNYEASLEDLEAKLDKLKSKHKTDLLKQKNKAEGKLAEAKSRGKLDTETRKERLSAAQEKRRELIGDYEARIKDDKERLLERKAELKALRKDAAAELREIDREALAGGRADVILQKQTAMQTLRAQIKMKEAEKREAAKILTYKRKLVNRIMKRPSGKVWYEYREKIRAVQDFLMPRVKEAKIRWEGELYDLETFRDKVEKENIIDILPESLVKRLFKKSIHDWTIAELEEMAAEVRNLEAAGKLEWEQKEHTRLVQQRRDREELMRQNAKNPDYKPALAAQSAERKEQVKKANSRIKQILSPTWTLGRLANWLDGGKDGAFTRLLVAREREAYKVKWDNADKRYDRVDGFMKERGMKISGLYSQTYTINGVGPENTDATFTLSDLMYIYLGVRDEKTREAILYGNLMNQAERSGELNTDKVLRGWGAEKLRLLGAAVGKALGADEKALAEMIASDFRDEFGRLNDVFANEFNVVMSQVRNYVPMLRQESTAAGEIHEKQQAREIMNVAGTSVKATPEKGFTVRRVSISPKNQRAIALDLYGTWRKAVERQEHFAAYTGYIRDLNAVFKSRNGESRMIQEQITQIYGSDMLRRIDAEINALANPASFKDDANIDRTLRALRGNLAVGYLAFNIPSVLKQFAASPMPYLAHVNPLELVSSAFKFMRDPKGFSDAIRQKSAIMRHRQASTMIADMYKAQETSKGKKGLRLIGEIGMKGLEIADWTSVSVGWNAVYERALKEGLSEDAAIAKADDVTVKTQPSAREQDLSPLFKNQPEAMKLLTQFTTSLNVIWNQLTYDIPMAFKNRQFKYAVSMISAYAVAGVGVTAVSVLAGSLMGNGDDDEDKWKRIFLFGSFSQFLDSVPLLGNGISAIAEQAVTGERRRLYQSPMLPAAEELIEAVSRVTAGDWEKAVRSFAEGGALFAGLPVSAPKQAEKVIGRLTGGDK